MTRHELDLGVSFELSKMFIQSPDFSILSFSMNSNRISLVLSLCGISVFVLGCNDPDYDAIVLRNEIKQLRSDFTDYREGQEKKNIESKRQPTAENDSLAKNKQMGEMKSKISRLTEQVVQLTETVSKLSALQESGAVESLESAGALLEKNESGAVVSVDLSQVRLGEFDLAVLDDLSQLTELTLYGSEVTAETFKQIGDLDTICKLNLEKTPFNLQAAKDIRGLKNLEELFLFRSDVSDACCAELIKFSKLKQIRCGQTRIGDDGLVELAKLQTLEAIDLSDCNRVSNAGLKSLSALPNLRFLKVFGKRIDDEGVQYVGQMSNMQVLGLNDTDVTDEGMKAIAGLNKLREIHLVRTQIGDGTMEVVSQLPQIRILKLRDTQISDKGIELIAGLENLAVLDLSETSSPGVTDASAGDFARMKNLKDLNLWTTKVSDETVSKLVDNQKLVKLNLDNTAISDEAVKTLGNMSQLTWLHIGSTKISDANMKSLLNLEKLTYLNISNTSVSEDVYFELDDFFAPKNCQVIGP